MTNKIEPIRVEKDRIVTSANNELYVAESLEEVQAMIVAKLNEVINFVNKLKETK